MNNDTSTVKKKGDNTKYTERTHASEHVQ